MTATPATGAAASPAAGPVISGSPPAPASGPVRVKSVPERQAGSAARSGRARLRGARSGGPSRGGASSAVASPSGASSGPGRPDLLRVPLATVPLPAIDFDQEPLPGHVVTRGGVTLHVREVDGPAGSVDDTIAAIRAAREARGGAPGGGNGDAAGASGDGAGDAGGGATAADVETAAADADPAVSDDGVAVYVHGLGGSSTNWTDLARLLSIRVPGIVVDLPGFGRSEPPRGYPYTMESHADTVAEFLRALDAGPVHLVGNSMGGAISLMIAARHPGLVRTLTLVSPAVPDLRPRSGRFSDPRLPLAYLPVVGRRFRRALATVTPHERALQMIRLCFARPEDVPPQRLAAAEEEFAERLTQPWARAALGRSTVGLLRSWLAPGPRSMWTTAAAIQAPTLVVWGAEDKLVDVRKAPRTARSIPRARLLVLPRTGHVAQMERPTTVARAMIGMFDEVATGRW